MLNITHYATLGDVPLTVRETFPDMHCDTQHCEFLVASQNGMPVGMAKIFAAAQNLNIEMLKVTPDAQHQGVATTLLEAIYQRAKKEGLDITTSGYTTDGQKYLRHIMEKLGASHGVATDVIGIC